MWDGREKGSCNVSTAACANKVTRQIMIDSLRAMYGAYREVVRVRGMWSHNARVLIAISVAW
jgi:hypothetical protein